MSLAFFALLAGTDALALSVEVGPGDDLATITSALAAGDEIVFTDGVYPLTGTLYWSGAGTEQAPIVLKAASGANPVLELGPNKDGSWASAIVYLSDASHVRIEGLHLRGGSGWDAEGRSFYGLVLSETTDVTVRDLEVSQTGSHSLVLSNNNSRATITRPHLHHTRDGDGFSAGCWDASCFTVDSLIDQGWIHDIGGDSYAVVLLHGSQGNTLRDTVVYGVDHRGLYLGSTESGPPNVIEGNAWWGLGDWAMEIYGAARVRNNIVFESEGGGIYTADPDRGTYQDLVISYNTVVNTADNAFEADDWTTSPGMVLSSNALCNPIGLGLDIERVEVKDGYQPLLDAHLSDNVVCGLVAGLTEEEGGVVAGSGWSDFLDVEGWELYPSATSSLRDQGDPSSAAWVPETDFNGAARPGDAPDVGAYEWSQDQNPGWVVSQGYKSLELTPGTGAEVMGGCCQKDADAAATSAALLLPLVGMGSWWRRRRPSASAPGDGSGTAPRPR